MRRTAWVLLSLAVLAPAAGAAQRDRETRERERELQQVERDIRQAERRLRELRRELGQSDRTRAIFAPRLGARVYGLTNRAFLGVTVRTAEDGAVDSVGAYIESVREDGPADEAGVEAGDIFLTFNGEPLAGRYPPASSFESAPGLKLIDLARELEDGDTARVRLRRGDDTREVAIVARQLDYHVAPEVVARSVEPLIRIREAPHVTALLGGWLDMELATLDDPDLAAYFDTSEGVLVVRGPHDDALQLKSGDVIVSIDGREPRSPSHVHRILRSYEPQEAVEIEVVRHGQRLTLNAQIPEASRHNHFFRGGDGDWEVLRWRNEREQ